jgi:hypothetical protein
MITKVLLGLSAIALVLASSPVHAGPLQRGHIATDAAWVVHLDVEQLKTSKVGQFLMKEMEKPEARDKIAAAFAIFNFDLRKHLNGITLSSPTQDKEDSTVVLYGTFDAERLATLAKAARDPKEEKHGAHIIRSWVDEKKSAQTGVDQRTHGCLYSPGVLVMGAKAQRVSEVLDVLDRKRPSLGASTGFAGLGTSKENAILAGAARKLDVPENVPSAAMLRQASGLSATAAEVGADFLLQVRLEAANDEVARQLQSVGQGMAALLSLQTENPEAVRLSQVLSFAQQGKEVSAAARMPSDELVALLEQKVAGKKRPAAPKP